MTKKEIPKIIFKIYNPGQAHVKVLDHILCYLSGTGNLCLIIGNWTSVDLIIIVFVLGFHRNADASHKNVGLDFRVITGFGVCFWYASA